MPLDDAADDLAVDEQRVDDRARVVDRGVAADPQRAGRALDLDDRGVARPSDT